MSEMVGLAAAVAALFGIGQAYLARRDNRLKQERAGESFETFTRSFGGEAIPEQVLAQVYAFFQDWKGDPAFPVRADDSIPRIYGVVNEDFWDMVNELSRTCGSPVSQPSEAQAVETVRDLVHLLARNLRAG